MDLFFTNESDFSRLGLPQLEVSRNVIPLLRGAPFIIADDGSYDCRLNAFFRALPGLGVPARNSWRAYGYDLLTWMRFLQSYRNKSIWEADRSDIDAYYALRVEGPETSRMLPRSWNRAVMALDCFYKWARDMGYVSAPPFFYRYKAPFGDGRLSSPGTERNSALKKGANRENVGFLTIAQYQQFRDVGIRGIDGTASSDSLPRVLTGNRNHVFSELLVTTGLRLQESTYLCVNELPTRDTNQSVKARPMIVSSSLGKGGIERTVYVPNRVLRLIDEYARVERTIAIERGIRNCFGIENPIYCTAASSRGVILADSQNRILPWSKLHPEERFRLVLLSQDGQPKEPLAIWLTDHGCPVKEPSWSSVFMRASHRCLLEGLQLYVHPHLLRHTFAVHMLSSLIRAEIGSSKLSEIDEEMYRRVLGDPLRRLQLLLGHASITSTHIYLHCIEEVQDLLDTAVTEFDELLEATS